MRVWLLAGCALLVVVGCASTPKYPPPHFPLPPLSEVAPRADWPSTTSEAAELVWDWEDVLGDEIYEYPEALSPEYGRYVAVRTGLYHGNEALIRAERIPHAAAYTIAARVREIIAEEGRPLHPWQLRRPDWPTEPSSSSCSRR